MSDLAGRLANRVQLTTDGHRAYLDAVWNAFGNDIDYAMLEKSTATHPPEHKHDIAPVCVAERRKRA
jgi:hypothetical protein